jgi:hypothetical protein
MSKLSPSKVQKLVARGRLVPIIQLNNEGKHVLMGYRRKNNRSTKSHEQYMFAEPILLEKQVESVKQ